MTSLRWRFFLVTWPLVVVAVAGVALSFDRWTGIEIEAFESMVETSGPMSIQRDAARAAGQWADGDLSEEATRSELSRIADADSVDLVLLTSAGRVAVTTNPWLEVRAGEAPENPQAVTFVLSAPDDPRTQMVELTGQPVLDRAGTLRGTLFVLPTANLDVRAGDRGALLRRDARRTLWTAFLIASAAAAALSLLLAGPLLGPIERLSSAAVRLQEGDFSARVSPSAGGELGRLENAFNQMSAELERAERQKRTLVGDVAHELRTPLTNVVGLLEAIDDGLRSPDAETLNLIAGEAGMLVALVEDLQELNLAESGQLPYVFERVDLVAEARNAIDVLGGAERGAKNDAPRVALCAEDLPTAALVRADRRRVAQILRNLLQNALSHTPQAGRVDLEVARRRGYQGIRVRDTGIGIPAEHLEMIWERFHRVDESRARDRGGRGLGLAIVKQLAQDMGGEVEVQSEPGAGSVFTVWLPVVAGS